LKNTYKNINLGGAAYRKYTGGNLLSIKFIDWQNIMKNNFDRLYTVDIFKKLNYNRKKEFQDLASLAASICETPVAFITLLDDEYNHFIAASGIEITIAPADTSFCRYTILQDDLMIINDTMLDDRFINNPFVCRNPAVRFYAGAALEANSGYKIGSLCVMDIKPKELTDIQKNALAVLSRQAIILMELELSQKLLNEQVADIETQNKLLTNIANVQSHEFRGPVASLLGVMNIIREDGYIAPKEYLLMIEDTIKKLDQKIHLIVEYTQIL